MRHKYAFTIFLKFAVLTLNNLYTTKMTNKTLLVFSLIGLFFAACGDTKDMDKPFIDLSGVDASPKNCSVVYRGETLKFKAVFSDDSELGNYTIEIHNNFDHHSHSTEGVDVVDCDQDTDTKSPEQIANAFSYIEDFTIPSGFKVFEAEHDIRIPTDKEPGDYHFAVRVTDKAGWQQLAAVSIKIADREE